MVETFKDFLTRLWVDVFRLLFLFLAVFGLSTVDSVFQFGEQFAFLSAVLSSTSVVLAVAGISHIVRRILFPSVDLKEFAKAALYEPLGASIVFLGICIVLSTFIVVNVMLLS
jgi:hypothetical protein